MSTRSTTHFTYGEQVAAKVYRHQDGYPEGHGVDLQRFFADVEAQAEDTRYSDPSYLAAKLVVWLAREFASTYSTVDGEWERVSHADTRPLDFLSVGVVTEDPSDVAYIYVVDCSKMDERGRPTVTCHAVGRLPHLGGGDGPVTLGAVVPIPALEEAKA